MNQTIEEEIFYKETSLGIVDYVVICAMFSISSGIGLYFHFSGGKQKTTSEFLFAGQNMSIFPVALSLMASGKSAITYLGVPADIYVYGTHFAFVNLGTSAGALVAGYLFIPVFFNTKSSTTYEYLQKRFGCRLRRICSFSFSLQVILYTAVCLYAPALALAAVTNLSLWTSIVTVAVVCTFYCTMGGMKAVLWTDVLQALLMYGGLIAILAKGSSDVGGVHTVWSRAEKGGRLIVPGFEMDFTSRYTFLNVFLYGFITSLSAYGVGQMQVQRLLTVSSVKKARIALFSSIPVIAIFHVVNVFVGLVVYANFYNCDPLTVSPNPPITKQDQLLPYFSLMALRNFPGMPGLCICGMLSAALSTLSSLFNSLTTVTVEDFMRPFMKMSEKRTAWAAKLITIFYGFLSLLFTYIVTNFGNVLQASTIVYGLVAGPTLGVFLLGVLTARTNEKGAIIGLLVSLAFTAWISFGSAQTNIKHALLPVSTSGCSNVNSTFTTTIAPMTTFGTPIEDNLAQDIFPMFKISYMWFSPLGTLTTIVVGYLASYIFKKPSHLEKHLLNPIARKFVLKEEKEDKCIQLSDLYSETEQVRKNENGEIYRPKDNI